MGKDTTAVQARLPCCQVLLLKHCGDWLLQVMTDFAAERASVVSRAQAQVTASSSEVDALRRLLRLKGRELQQLRKLGQEVLLQRSEVEIFLLSSLHQVIELPAGEECTCTSRTLMLPDTV